MAGHSRKRSRRHGGHDEEHENHERWLVSYADMLTLLFALFVVLYSMSMLNKSKWEAFQSSFAKNKPTGHPQAATPTPTPTATPTKPPQQPPPAGKISHDQLAQLQAELQAAIDAHHLQNAVTLEIDTRGLEINLTDGVLFDSGASVLKPDGVTAISVVAPHFAKYSNEVFVEGHTDNQPVGGDPYGNWNLSTDRADSVLRYLLANLHVPNPLHAEGYADTHPLVPNTNPGNMAKNRRVSLVVYAPEGSAAGGA